MSLDEQAKLDSSAIDMLMVRPILPAILAILYGGYEFLERGLSTQHCLWTYVLVVGGISSVIAIIICTTAISSVPVRSWRNAFAVWSGFIPYVFSLYLMGFLGVYSLWNLFADEFTLIGLIFGIFWILLGYRMLYTFWIITELVPAQSRMET